MPDEPIIRPNFSGAPSIRGTRLSVYSIMDFHFAGDPPEEIADAFRITLDEARAAMTYIDEHKEELMPRYQEILDRNRRGNPPHIEAMLRQSHEKFVRLQAEFARKKAVAAQVGATDAPIAR